MGTRGVFRGRAAARGSRYLPFGGGGGEVGVGGEVGGGGEVGERCTSQGGAKQAARERPNALFKRWTRGRPCRAPNALTPNAQHPTPWRPNAPP